MSAGLPSDRAQVALIRALGPVAGPFAVAAARSVPWASATFEGARHRLALVLHGEDVAARAARLCATLPEAEIAIRGGFVADLAAVAGEGGTIAIEALTIDEPAAEPPAGGAQPWAAASRLSSSSARRRSPEVVR